MHELTRTELDRVVGGEFKPLANLSGPCGVQAKPQYYWENAHPRNNARVMELATTDSPNSLPGKGGVPYSDSETAEFANAVRNLYTNARNAGRWALSKL
jgi:hypothetical protein